MTILNRRKFLTLAGAGFTAAGLNHRRLQAQADRYAQTLAQTTPRKLALLVGINDYPSVNQYGERLNGCVTDTELQQYLLIHRFGFNPRDVQTVLDRDATRTNILDAFEHHLIHQAKPGDVVVFHYSGHGSQVFDPDRDFPDGLNSTLVPFDSPLPFGYPFKGGAVRDITGHTLFLLMKAVQTDLITIVLDSCFSGGGKRGNLILRSRPGHKELDRSQDAAIQLHLSPEELDYQQQWLSRLHLSPTEFIEQRRQGVAKGVVIASATRNQTAGDTFFGSGANQFHAGVFTHEFTQYLWQRTGNESFNNVIVQVSRDTRTKASKPQDPEFEYQPDSTYDQREIYFTDRLGFGAEAVIIDRSEDQIEILLGGVEPQVLDGFGPGTIFCLVDDMGNDRGGLGQLESRQGIRATCRLLSPRDNPTRGNTPAQELAQAGRFLREQVRGIPREITLRVGLDSSLGGQREALKQALDNLERIEAVALFEQEVQVLVGRMTEDYRATLAESSPTSIPTTPALNSLGLFSPGLEIIPNSFGPVNETIELAVSRLTPKLKGLLAARLIKLTLNAQSSRLKLSAQLKVLQRGEIEANSFTVRGWGHSGPPRALRRNAQAETYRVQAGQEIQFQVQNQEDRPLYIAILLISPDGDLDVLFPVDLTGEPREALLESGRELRVPVAERDRFTLRLKPPLGVAEALIIASASPLNQALEALEQLMRDRTPLDQTPAKGVPVKITEPGDVVEALLVDLHGASRGGSATSSPGSGYRIDVTQIATLSLTFEIVLHH
jgi:hypothetical protein